MKLKLKRIAPLQTGKMFEAFYGLTSMVIVPFLLVFIAMGGLAAANRRGAAGVPLIMGMELGSMIFLPIMYALVGFVAAVIGAFIYNQTPAALVDLNWSSRQSFRPHFELVVAAQP